MRALSLAVICSITAWATAQPLSCGTGTVLDPVTNQCVVRERRQESGPRLVTTDGDLVVETSANGRFGVRKTDGTIAYADAADAIPAAIQLGYNIFRDVDRLETVIDVRESLRREIAAVADRVDNQLDDAAATTALTLATANASLSSISSSLSVTLGRMASCASNGQVLGAGNQCVSAGTVCPALSSIRRTNNATFMGDLREPVMSAQERVTCNNAPEGFGPNPSSVQCLRSGAWSNSTVTCQNCSTIACTDGRTCGECANGVCLLCSNVNLGASSDSPGRSCQAIMESYTSAPPNGIYWLTINGVAFQTYCDFETAGGGWTLISSVHEDNVAAHQPDNQDRWTSANGNGRGARAWYDTSTFGTADRATTTDFKSPAYHMPSQNLMMWHVANGASTARYKTDARYRYYTNNDFLSDVPGQMFPGIYAGARRTTLTSSNVCGRRLTTPIRWETNNARAFYDYELSPLVQSNHIRNAGENKMDFAVGCDGDCATCTFAVCPAISWVAGGCGNTEHACIGGAITNSRFRSDFTEWDHSGLPGATSRSTGWSAGGRLIRSAVFFFVR